MKKIKSEYSHGVIRLCIFSALLICLAMTGNAWAAFGEDMERPKPEFTREGDKIVAKLIPRGKSTSVNIEFEVLGGKLKDVKGLDFDVAERPEVDVKNFNSSLFMVEIVGVSVGGDVKVSVTSQFFSSSTTYYVFNEKLEKPWMMPQVQNLSLPNLVQQLVIDVKDGGPFDSDGAADGKIFFVGGPRDSFWGYALGTLFIRFFGIFIVLGILMIGMFISGKIFQALEGNAEGKVESLVVPAQPKPAVPDSPAVPTPVVSPTSEAEIAAAAAVALEIATRDGSLEDEIAAAIMTALHIHLFGHRNNTLDTNACSQESESVVADAPVETAVKPAETAPSGSKKPSVQAPSGWVQQGREQLTENRVPIFNR